ncbi:MAG: hypothetical protein IH936_10415 [Acidobacteria bacterium]|nr:hypothetical protein [Acidobacteriota bacterium]
MSKRQPRRPHLDTTDRTAQLFDDEVEALWKAPASHETIRSYLEEAVGKKRG